MMRRYLLLICFCLLTMAAHADRKKPVAIKHQLQTDTATKITVRSMDANAIEKFSKQRDFDYSETRPDISWWDRFWMWFWSLFRIKAKNDAQNSAGYILAIIFKYTLIALGVAGIIFIILRMSGIDLGNLIRGRSKSVQLPYSEYLEDINAINFDQETDNAIEQGNYRLAVRLLYLKSLKKLSDAGLIDWQLNKTNTSYVSELANTDQRSIFGSLTRQFEYVWYGEFAIGKQAYAHIQSEFNDFNKSIS